jgi:CO/xanthine dehydrogenase Mo-binding subunit
MYAQLLADWLGLDFERIRVVQGDTDQVSSEPFSSP